MERLAREVPNIVGMKDSSGDMTQTEEFIRRTSDIGFKVFGGKDTLISGQWSMGRQAVWQQLQTLYRN